MKVLVTGATGFIGWHCVEQLMKHGHEVSCLLRPQSKVESVNQDIVSSVVADYYDHAALKSATRGFDAVVHCAGIVRALKLPTYWRANVESTENLCMACRSNGIERMVVISSLSAGGMSRPDIPRDETMNDEPLTYYGISKLGAELAARRIMQACTVLRPCSVYGPRERDIFTIFKLVKTRGIDVRPRGTTPALSFVNGIDVARAVCATLASNATVGKCYYLSDGVVIKWDDFLGYVESAVGRSARKISLPLWSVELYALLGEFFASLSGRVPLITREKVFEMSKEAWTCSPARFISDTGFSISMPIEKGVHDTASWYFEQGWIKR